MSVVTLAADYAVSGNKTLSCKLDIPQYDVLKQPISLFATLSCGRKELLPVLIDHP
jgi:hypothetical protein